MVNILHPFETEPDWRISVIALPLGFIAGYYAAYEIIAAVAPRAPLAGGLMGLATIAGMIYVAHMMAHLAAGHPLEER